MERDMVALCYFCCTQTSTVGAPTGASGDGSSAALSGGVVVE